MDGIAVIKKSENTGKEKKIIAISLFFFFFLQTIWEIIKKRWSAHCLWWEMITEKNIYLKN